MLIEQIIEFKSSRKFFEWIIIYCSNFAGGNVQYLTFPYLGQIFSKFNTKMKDFKGVLD